MYERVPPQNVAALQLEKLSIAWRRAATEQPFYMMWRRQHGLPLDIPDLATFEQFPLIDKKVLQEAEDLVFEGANPARVYSTGGSTNAPTLFPRGGEVELAERYVTGMLGRAWWGIRPGDSYVHIWGLSALMGRGPSAQVRRAVRRAKDVVVGATRFNSYDLTPESLERQWQVISRLRPSYVVGFTSSIVRLTAHLQSTGLKAAGLPAMRAVQVSGETMDEHDATRLKSFWQVPVITEYGSSELGAVAGSKGGTWPLQVFWDTVLVQMQGEAPVVSTLHDRVFPLFRYDIGDVVVDPEVVNGTTLKLGGVHGRRQDILSVGSTQAGRTVEFHVLVIAHVMKQDRRIRTCQIQQKHAGLRILVTGDLDKDDMPQVHRHLVAGLQREHPDVDGSSVEVMRLKTPWLSKAGKQVGVLPPGVMITGND